MESAIYEIKKSNINGKGVFALKNIPNNLNLGLAIKKIKNTGNSDNDYIRTELGKYVNHSIKPNLKAILKDNSYYYITIQDIKKGGELTVNYNNFKIDGKKEFKNNMKRLIAKPRDRGLDGKPIDHMETSTKSQANFAHNLLHMWWNDSNKTDWTRQQIIDEHTNVVKAMKDFNMNYKWQDNLDETLPDYLKPQKEKTAEIYSGFNIDNNYYEVYKNPTPQEIEEFPSIRGVINNDGIFIWSGEIWHRQLQKVIQDPIDINGFRFAFDSGDWEFNLNFQYNLEDVLKKINDNYDFFNSVGDLNCYMNIGPDKNGVYWSSKNYDELKIIVEEQKQKQTAKNKKRLVKKAAYLHCHNCGWDNGDFGYPNKDTIYETEEEYENKNPNHICPNCKKGILDID